MSAACDKAGVDRNTVVCNAAVAELAIGAPPKYAALKQHHSWKDKLSDFTKTCFDTIHCNSVTEDTVQTY